MSEQTANLCTTDAAESLRAVVAERDREIERLRADYNEACEDAMCVARELTALKAQPSGVVLPEPKKEIVAWGHDMGGNYDEGHADGWNDALDEVARLNSSPVSAGDDAQYPPCDYCAEPLSYHPWHGSGLINGVESRHIHACDKCRHLLPTVSAGGVDERAAFEREVVERYGYTWASIYSRRQGQGYSAPSLCMAWIMWKARATLSAPSHGEQVRDVLPVPLVPTDEMLNAGKSMLHKSNGRGAREKCGRIFSAMLAAAPSAPSQGEQVRDGWAVSLMGPDEVVRIQRKDGKWCGVTHLSESPRDRLLYEFLRTIAAPSAGSQKGGE